MDNAFCIALYGKHNQYCCLELPATYYQLQDAMDKLQMAPGEKPDLELLHPGAFPFLHDHLGSDCDLYQLNTLLTRLEGLSDMEKAAFEGLVQMEAAKDYGPIPLSLLLDLAYSTDCCHVVNATTDEQLGRFYAENDFIPALEKVPDSIFEYLDFDMLGRKSRFEEGGVFVSHGYVIQHEDLKQVHDSLDVVLKPPSYAIRLLVTKGSDQQEPKVTLELPATQSQLCRVLEALGESASWDQVAFWTEDSAIPDLLENLECNDIQDLNQLAEAIKCLERYGQLTKLKAVILATDCHEVVAAAHIAENLDDYLLQPDQRSPKEVALQKLHTILDEQTLSMLQEHVNLNAYGRDILANSNAVLTPYGLVVREDGEPLLCPTSDPKLGGMQMQ